MSEPRVCKCHGEPIAFSRGCKVKQRARQLRYWHRKQEDWQHRAYHNLRRRRQLALKRRAARSV